MTHPNRITNAISFAATILILLACCAAGPATRPAAVDATSLRGKVMCGYQGWFRCPGDAAGLGWVHWSRDARQISAASLTFEMWPDMSDYSAAERYAVPGFTQADGTPAYLFSSDNARTVLRHFQWMQDAGIDGAWLQQFVLELPGGPGSDRYPSRLRVRNHMAPAARQTGRVWAITYDIAGTPTDRIFDLLTANWKQMVDDKVTADPRYMHEGRRPVVEVFGFYSGNQQFAMTPELANRLIEFFKTGPYAAFLVGGGDWNWRAASPAWRDVYRRLDGYIPWNVGNYATDAAGVKHAAVGRWVQDKQEFERDGGLWLPAVYPGFSWDNLQHKPPGATTLPRRGGEFLWEQFHALAELKASSAFVAMFDEVDEGTAIFKVTNSPPRPGHFVDYEGLPSDWYLRLVGEGAAMLRGDRAVTREIPVKR